MNVDKITVFVDAVRLGSFHKAADKYFYTPSALTRLADSLEKELGVKLIDRSHGGITLTKEGEVLFPYLEELVRQKQELIQAASALSGARTSLTVGCYASVSTSLLPEMLLRFQQVEPNIKISVAVGNSVEDMKRRGAELCLADESESAGKRFLHVQTDEYVAVVKEGCFPAKRVLCKQDFEGSVFLMPENKKVQQWATEISTEKNDVLADDDAVIVSMIKNGLGISVLPYLSVKNHPRGVKLLKITPPLCRHLGVIYEDKLSSAAKKLLRFLSKPEIP